MKKNSKIRNWTKIDFKKSVKIPEKVLGKIRDKKKSGKTPETRLSRNTGKILEKIKIDVLINIRDPDSFQFTKLGKLTNSEKIIFSKFF